MNPLPQTKNASIHAWIIHHDDSRAFIVAYIGLAVVLSAFVSLFWLVVVVSIHFCLEYIRQRHLAGPDDWALGRALWELRLDWSLIVFAMVIALYMDYAIGVAGLRLAPRLGRAVSMGTRGTARFAVWTRILRAILLSLDDLAQVIRTVIMRRSRRTAPKPLSAESAPDQSNVALTETTGKEEAAAGWTPGDYFIALFFVVSTVLLLLTPILTEHSLTSFVWAMLAELHPLP